MPDFTLLPVYDGVGPFHFNRYRVVFEKPAATSAKALSNDYVSQFPNYFNSQYASVQWGSRNYLGKPTLKFHGYFRKLGVDVAQPHHDWVEREWCDPDVGFTAQTLKREFFDPVDDGEAAAGGSALGYRPSVVPYEPVTGIAGAIAAVHYNRMHFLAGRRSWRMDEGIVFGETANTCVLETIAVEQFSARVFALSDAALGMEKFIPNIWIANLTNYVRMRGLVTLPSVKQNSSGWKNKTSVYFFVQNFPNLASLNANQEFQDAYPLYNTILP